MFRESFDRSPSSFGEDTAFIPAQERESLEMEKMDLNTKELSQTSAVETSMFAEESERKLPRPFLEKIIQLTVSGKNDAAIALWEKKSHVLNLYELTLFRDAWMDLISFVPSEGQDTLRVIGYQINTFITERRKVGDNEDETINTPRTRVWNLIKRGIYAEAGDLIHNYHREYEDQRRLATEFLPTLINGLNHLILKNHQDAYELVILRDNIQELYDTFSWKKFPGE